MRIETDVDLERLERFLADARGFRKLKPLIEDLVTVHRNRPPATAPLSEQADFDQALYEALNALSEAVG